MTAITSALFQVGNDYRVGFLIKNGLCNAIEIYWGDGYEEKISRYYKHTPSQGASHNVGLLNEGRKDCYSAQFCLVTGASY